MEKIENLFFKKMNAFDTMSVEFMDSFISSDPEITALIQQYEEKAVPLLAGFIEQGKQEGFFNKELSLETIMFYINLFSSQAMQQLGQMQEGEAKRRLYR